jgi:hypothetical protein
VCLKHTSARLRRTPPKKQKQKVNSSSYQAFDSPSYPHLATLGIDVAWNTRALLRGEGAYRPR